MDKDEWDSYDALKSFDSLMGPDRFHSLRRNLMNQAPSAEELQSMLERVEGTDVRPRGFELRDELEAGRIVPTLLINEHIERAAFRSKSQ
jgi:hypothetical protein